ncbi:hypothetical protein EU811_20615 [Arthrobacter sp. TS-15]|uniref:2-keto-4-pentenoate hydratase n=1 Tax=Arthrobacter sp. TS-15 TaxID=2510797 RepID=UPI00115E89F7|nr:fumarylacetoacetate hydrolase family protein [Arthrobacter sp. TS-15]TQS88948.1 hypothetical protein EU811_20615 [Arthrobacter sp. TS-15]
MAVSEPDLDKISASLGDAERTGEPTDPVRLAGPALTLDDAYAIQGRTRARRLAAGERIVGHKIGLTSEAMQKQLGVDQPDFGFLTDAMVVADGGSVDPSKLIAPRLEPEFAFRIDRALPVDPSLQETREAIGAVAVAIEIIDSRIANWDIALVDTVADNASSARLVSGPWRHVDQGVLEDLPGTEVRLICDGDVVASGLGSAVLGDPVTAVHWLARALGRYGEALREGEIILAGAVSGAMPLTAGHEWTVSAPAFRSATFRTIREERKA